jgi:hypothetical protein
MSATTDDCGFPLPTPTLIHRQATPTRPDAACPVLPYRTDAAEPWLVRDAGGRCIAKCATAADAEFFARSANAYFDLYDSLKAMVEATGWHPPGVDSGPSLAEVSRQAAAYLAQHDSEQNS